MAHDGVLEAAVIGAQDENGLIKPKAYVVVKPGVARGPELLRELDSFVKSRLVPYQHPRWIEFIEELPKTSTGKIQRYVLRQAATEIQDEPRRS
jgi:benzoate-CoA ligase